MADSQDENPEPAVRFKRRKVTHSKRVHLACDAPDTGPASNATEMTSALSPNEAHDYDDSATNLREALRKRKRPRDRYKDAVRKHESSSALVVHEDAPKSLPYASRFVAQTGQVVDRDDEQLNKYVEARIAEQNYRKHGWPIPAHLEALVEVIAPDVKPSSASATTSTGNTNTSETPADMERSMRMAAGQGRIEEVDIEPAVPRKDTKWGRLGTGGSEEVPTEKVRFGRNGRPRRAPKQRNSDDIKRDQMVEAIMSESKLDFFDTEAPPDPRFSSTGDNDEAFLEHFRAEYLESMEEAKQQQQQKKAAQAGKGAKEAPKGPKMGGGKSGRAKLRLQEEQAAKAKR